MPNVNGPTGPRGPAPTTGPATTSTTPQTNTLPEAPTPQPNRGWGTQAAGATAPKAGSDFGSAPARRSGPSLDGGAQPLDLTYRPQVAPAVSPGVDPSQYQAQVATALDKFSSSLNDTLHLDPSASDLSKGVKPFQNGDSISADQQNKMQNAAVDLLKSVPIGALAPGVAQQVESSLKDAGLPVDGLAGKSLDQMGDIGGKIAKQLAGQLKDKSPAAYYGLAAGAAAAAGYEAWAGGSDGLKKLGIKPEFSKGFFDDQLKVKVGAAWDPHFQNIRGTATLDTNINLNDNWKLSGSATYDSRSGFAGANAGVTYTSDHLTASGNVSVNSSGLQSVGANMTYTPNDQFKLSAGISHDFTTDRTTANAEADWQVRKNVDFALSGSVDSRGESQVGVGMKIRF
ncbi:MAG: hypothetical protein QM723_13530 [Myxococcaceae bacterium]